MILPERPNCNGPLPTYDANMIESYKWTKCGEASKMVNLLFNKVEYVQSSSQMNDC